MARSCNIVGVFENSVPQNFFFFPRNFFFVRRNFENVRQNRLRLRRMQIFFQKSLSGDNKVGSFIPRIKKTRTIFRSQI